MSLLHLSADAEARLSSMGLHVDFINRLQASEHSTALYVGLCPVGEMPVMSEDLERCVASVHWGPCLEGAVGATICLIVEDLMDYSILKAIPVPDDFILLIPTIDEG